ncbi:Uncharacterised protein [Vibrio cholerae]|uniref:Uncharacterized protein n=1 Tax=Vibrio cholerae TaxID=666 RepID=A0A655ZPY8_VIBCL|nr:Uncharacterised protein [Vibrio cholerae]
MPTPSEKIEGFTTRSSSRLRCSNGTQRISSFLNANYPFGLETKWDMSV